MQLVIGDKNWSTWSLRPWLVLKRAGIAFDEAMVHLRRQEQTAADIARYSPSGKVPALIDGNLTVWDSLAICEYLADRFPQAALWPSDPSARALARAAAAEMHSGFSSLRNECPMDLKLTTKLEISEGTVADVKRLTRLFMDMRARFGVEGEFLAGGWSIADAFFTPVATRFRTYGIEVSEYGDDGSAAAYCCTLLEQPEFRAWEAAALAEA